MGDFSAAGFNNIRFYLNPFILKLEPMMSDQEHFQYIEKNVDDNSLYKMSNGFLKAKTLTRSRREKLHRETLDLLDTNIPYELSEKYFPF